MTQIASLSLSTTARTAVTDRLVFFDNLRVACMTGVILHHVGQAYGPTGFAWPIQEAEQTHVLAGFFAVNRSFGMSLFFMIAGYFAVISCDRKGPRAFLKDRAIRLGVPLLLYSIAMIPLQVFVFATPATRNQIGAAWPIEVGHLWFIQHLLIFSAAYAGGRM